MSKTDPVIIQWKLSDITGIKSDYGFCGLGAGDERAVFVVKFSGTVGENRGAADRRFIEATIACGIIGFGASGVILDLRELTGLDAETFEAALQAVRDPVTGSLLPVAVVVSESALQVKEVISDAYQGCQSPDIVAQDLNDALARIRKRMPVVELGEVQRKLDLARGMLLRCRKKQRHDGQA